MVTRSPILLNFHVRIAESHTGTRAGYLDTEKGVLK